MAKGRPKGSKNKPKLVIIKPNETKLQIPKDPDKYRLRRAYWLMLMLERKFVSGVPVTPRELGDATDRFVKLTKDYTDAKKGVEKQGLVQDQSKDTAAGVGKNGQTGVGLEVPPVNPLA